jgi:hypothetical protein
MFRKTTVKILSESQLPTTYNPHSLHIANRLIDEVSVHHLLTSNTCWEACTAATMPTSALNFTTGYPAPLIKEKVVRLIPYLNSAHQNGGK